MTRPNCSVTSQYLTYLQRRKGPSCSRVMEHGQVATWVSHLDVSLKSFLLSLVQTKLMSHPNSSITSQYLTWLQTKKGHPGT